MFSFDKVKKLLCKLCVSIKARSKSDNLTLFPHKSPITKANYFCTSQFMTKKQRRRVQLQLLLVNLKFTSTQTSLYIFIDATDKIRR